MNPPNAQGSDRPRQHLARRVCALALLIAVTQSGCVALGLPSERHHDPADQGGMFGSWKQPVRPGRWLQQAVSGTSAGAPQGNARHGESLSHAFGEVPAEIGCASGPDDSEWVQTPPEPEVPWPQYHPVPTRPIFAGSQPLH